MLKRFIKPVYAHCDVPCGIYETDTMTHAAETCRRMVQKQGDLGDFTDPKQLNEFTRLVITKEQQAQMCKDELYLMWSDYFKPEHLKKTPDLHDKFWKATKQCSIVKQTTDLNECEILIDMVHDISHLFAESNK